ncbi:alpha/beta fold hydrolase [Shewanella sp. YIC-542]|uniref:alpha/beta fold hydrolase n=1 Tax=Shewanella mytili TaxID=3377111 RepID=UPI00398E9312
MKPQPSTVDALSQQWLDVGDGHVLHLAQYGNPAGIPVLFLHGGPGSGCHVSDLQLFDLQKFRVLLLDQRGAGQSHPAGGLRHNDVLALLTDIERLRHWLGLERWCVAGGSFGATLGLIYGGLCPQRILAQCYWGVFVPSAAGRSWLYGSSGAAKRFPVDYQRWCDTVPGDTENAVLAAYASALQWPTRQLTAAWGRWERILAFPWHPEPGERLASGPGSARIENHYACNHYFNAYTLMRATLNHWPQQTQLLQGEWDWVCPPWLLQQLLADKRQPASLQLVPGGHHSLADGRMCQAVIAAIAQMAENVPSPTKTGNRL